MKPPRRKAITATPPTSDKERIALLTRERSASLERETANSQVLAIISNSPTDLETVFETILSNATRLCEASYGTLFLCEGEAFRIVARHGEMPAVFAAERQRGATFRPGPDSALARATRTRHGRCFRHLPPTGSSLHR